MNTIFLWKKYVKSGKNDGLRVVLKKSYITLTKMVNGPTLLTFIIQV